MTDRKSYHHANLKLRVLMLKSDRDTLQTLDCAIGKIKSLAKVGLKKKSYSRAQRGEELK